MAAPDIEPQTYSNLTAFLVTAGVVVPLFRRFRISPIPGFLAAGLMIGPYGLGRFVEQVPWLDYVTISKPEQISQIAEFGVVFLLFMIGLELSWARLKRMRKMVFGLGGVYTLTSAALIAGVGLLFGLGWGAAAAVGFALAMSSTAMVMPVLEQGGRMHAPSGQAAFSVLLFQDIAVAPILIGLTIAAVGAQGGGADIYLLVGKALLGLAVILGVGRLLIRPMLRSAARTRSTEIFMAASLLIVVTASLAAETAGLSMAMGAFIAGVLMAETEYRHEAEVLIEPFKGLLMGLFFLSVAVGLNLSLLAAKPLFILGVAIGMTTLQAVVAIACGRAFGLKLGNALEAGLMLAAGGEFAFVILNRAVDARLLEPELAQALIVSAAVTMMAIPALGWLGGRVRRVADAAEAEPDPAGQVHVDNNESRVLIAGYGRVGRLVADMLSRHEIAWTAIDADPHRIDMGREARGQMVYGDASRGEMLSRCGLANAPAVVVTLDDPDAAYAVTVAVRRQRPDVVLVSRARDAKEARKLYELGATDAVPETIEASLQLSEAVLVDLGVPMGLVIASIHEKRDEIRAELKPHAPDASAMKTAGGAGGGATARGRMRDKT